MFDIARQSVALLDDRCAKTGEKRKFSACSQGDSDVETFKLRAICEHYDLDFQNQAICTRHANLSLGCLYASKHYNPINLTSGHQCCQIQATIGVLQNQIDGLIEINEKLHYSSTVQRNCHACAYSIDKSMTKASSNLLKPLYTCGERSCLSGSNLCDCSVHTSSIGKNAILSTDTRQRLNAEQQLETDIVGAASPRRTISLRQDFLHFMTRDEVAQMLKLYVEEIHVSYPIIDIDQLHKLVDRIYSPFSHTGNFRNSKSRTIETNTSESDTNIELRLVLACALVISGQGQHKLGQKLYKSVREAVGAAVTGQSSIHAIKTVTLAAMYYFQTDREIQAWRYIGIAGRQCIEMGLHRQASLLAYFPNFKDYQQATRIFWTVYALDRRWSFSTGLPFLLQDSDIDSDFSDPGNDYPDLKHVTPYNRMGREIWTQSTNYQTSEMCLDNSSADYLEFRLQKWYENLPDDLRVNRETVAAEFGVSDRKQHRLRLLMFLRRNQAHVTLYRRYLYSTAMILENNRKAELVVKAGLETINTLVQIHQTSDIYRTQQMCYNYFLVQALAVLFLAVAHAPARYYDETQQAFNSGGNLIKSLCPQSIIARRLWRTIGGLQDLWSKIGQPILAAGTVTQVDQHQEHQQQTFHDYESCNTAKSAAEPSINPLKPADIVKTASENLSKWPIRLGDELTIPLETIDLFNCDITLDSGSSGDCIMEMVSEMHWQGPANDDARWDAFL